MPFFWEFTDHFISDSHRRTVGKCDPKLTLQFLKFIINNAKVFKNVPLQISYQGELILRGEAVIGYKDFEKINEQIQEAEAKYKNPRNLCSGSVRQLNSEIGRAVIGSP